MLGSLHLTQSGLTIDRLQLARGPDTSEITGSIAGDYRQGFGGGALDLHAKLRNAGVGILDYILRPTVNVRTGELYADLVLAGTFSAPLLSGQARILHGSLYLPDVNALITDANVQAVCDRNRITIGQISGASGGGQVQANGYLVLRGLNFVSDLSLDIKTKSVSLSIPPDIAATVTGAVNLSWASDRTAAISGSVNLEEALVTSQVTSEGGPAAASGGGILLDLKVTADRNVWLRNDLVELELGGDMAIKMNAGGMSVSGELDSRQGKVYVLDHVFNVTRGILRFDTPGAIDPSLDVLAELPSSLRDSTHGSSAQNVKIIATVSGRLSKPTFALSSDPPVLSEADILSYLASNVTPEELASLDNRTAFNRLVSDRLISYVSRQVSTRLQRYLALDVLDLQPSSLTSDANLKITVGKYIGRSLFVSYTASTAQLAPDAFKLEYFLSTGREVIGERSEDGFYNLRFQVKLRY